MKLIDADKLYKLALEHEIIATQMINVAAAKKDKGEVLKWCIALHERTAFKFDVADAEEAIIHCKDCTYFDTEWKPIHAEDNNYYCVINDGIWNINEHCSRAERKVTNENGKRN